MTRSNETHEVGTRLVLATLLACLFNVASLFLLNYQNYVVDLALQQRALTMKYPYHADSIFPPPAIQLLYLAPAAIAIIFRRTAAISVTYFGTLLAIFVGRSYYLIQFCRAGLDTISKFDWAALLATILGAVSLAILAVWILFLFINLVRHKLKLRPRAESDE